MQTQHTSLQRRLAALTAAQMAGMAAQMAGMAAQMAGLLAAAKAVADAKVKGVAKDITAMQRVSTKEAQLMHKFQTIRSQT